MDVDLLVGAGEIVRRLGLKRVQELHCYRRSLLSFPEAVFGWRTRGAGAHVWYWPDIERWARRKGGLPESARTVKKTAPPTQKPSGGRRADGGL